jgi:hypothetical protein
MEEDELEEARVEAATERGDGKLIMVLVFVS